MLLIYNIISYHISVLSQAPSSGHLPWSLSPSFPWGPLPTIVPRLRGLIPSSALDGPCTLAHDSTWSKIIEKCVQKVTTYDNTLQMLTTCRGFAALLWKPHLKCLSRIITVLRAPHRDLEGAVARVADQLPELGARVRLYVCMCVYIYIYTYIHTLILLYDNCLYHHRRHPHPHPHPHHYY